MEEQDALRPLGRSVSNAVSTIDDAASTSLIYSEDESLSDAYFSPQNKTRDDGEQQDEDHNWEAGKRTTLWGSELMHVATESGAATEDTALLRKQRKTSRLVARDVLWSILFVLHVLLLAVFAVRLGRGLIIHPAKNGAIKTTNALANAGPTVVIHESQAVDSIFVLGQTAMTVTALSTGFAVPVSFFFFAFLMFLDKAMIYIMLGLSNLFGLACVILGLSLQPYGGAAIAGFTLFVGTLSYTVHQWKRIRFSTVLLHTAASSFRPDVGVVAGGAMLALLAAMLLWEWAGIGIIDSFDMVQCTKSDGKTCSLDIENWDIVIILLMLFSLTWIVSVVINTMRVITAGLTATWWFAPQYVPPGACGTMIASRSVGRSLSICFGSVCLGSLVVGVTTAWIDSLLSCCHCCAAAKNDLLIPASRSSSMSLTLKDDLEVASLQRVVNRLCRRVRWYYSSWNKFAFCFVGMCKCPIVLANSSEPLLLSKSC